MLSGRSTVAVSTGLDTFEKMLNKCCGGLGLERTGNEKFIHGTEEVPRAYYVGSWPGLRPFGEVSEYQLVL
eukprot:4626763-Amphidinium_carterae.1